ncbi:TetR/AcrR family transcriptional regulator [Candidatus Bipolaricaulota bacterium]|nr:TetR/AcrR family transcriptional regulator [Candidatus Bipolaricaulota bacterium]TFH11231.1 MAG: TetR/AcrR family transcriptional regulator [Candidatus Atribacteria bacterium]
MDNKEKISQAAVRVFSREGFHRARMKTIAQEAGVAVGTIYNYFKDKDDLLLSVFEAGIRIRMDFLEELGRTSLPIRDQIQHLLESHFAQIREQQELAELILFERFHRGSRLRDRVLALQKLIIDQIAEFIRKGVAQGWVRPCHPQVVAQALYDLVQTMTACWVFSTPDEEADIFASAPKELADLIWMGLGVKEVGAHD